MRHFNKTLVAWAMRKYRRLKGHKTRASLFLEGIVKRQPGLFIHWRRGMGGHLLDVSGVSREAPAPFCEGLGVRFPRPTHHNRHWILEVAFEDACRVRQGHADENFATLRRIGLHLLKQEKTAKVGNQTKRLMAGWDNNYLLKGLAKFRCDCPERITIPRHYQHFIIAPTDAVQSASHFNTAK